MGKKKRSLRSRCGLCREWRVLERAFESSTSLRKKDCPSSSPHTPDGGRSSRRGGARRVRRMGPGVRASWWASGLVGRAFIRPGETEDSPGAPGQRGFRAEEASCRACLTAAGGGGEGGRGNTACWKQLTQGCVEARVGCQKPWGPRRSRCGGGGRIRTPEIPREARKSYAFARSLVNEPMDVEGYATAGKGARRHFG